LVRTRVPYALALIDAEGLHGFSMRRLAEKLGVGPMTLYGYVRTSEEILDGAIERAMHGLFDDLDPAAPWEDQLRTAVGDLHRALRAHPGVLELMLAKPAPSPQLDLVRESLVGTLRRGGFSDEEVWEAVGVVGAYAVGFASSAASHAQLGAAVERMRQLPLGKFPHLAGLADGYPSHLSERAFERGLGYLIAGLRDDVGRVAPRE
jgi:AcrR family transcriptional regulator